MLKYKKITLENALVIEVTNDLEVLIRKKRPRRRFLNLLRALFNVESLDSKGKYSALSVVHDRITFE